ncbi:hypothetical protein [Halostagnicola bangensis]
MGILETMLDRTGGSNAGRTFSALFTALSIDTSAGLRTTSTNSSACPFGKTPTIATNSPTQG